MTITQLYNLIFKKVHTEPDLLPDFSKGDQAFPKRYWDLPEVQSELGVTQEIVDKNWAERKENVPVFMFERNDEKYFISNYDS